MRTQNYLSVELNRIGRTGRTVSFVAKGLLLVSLFFLAGCNRQVGPTSQIVHTGEWHTFEGTWSASGTRQTIHLETDHRCVDLRSNRVAAAHRRSRAWSRIPGEDDRLHRQSCRHAGPVCVD